MRGRVGRGLAAWRLARASNTCPLWRRFARRLPRKRGRKSDRSRDACAPELCKRTDESVPLLKEGRRSAARRTVPLCPRLSQRGARLALTGRARLAALHRGTRQRSRNHIWLSPRTAFPQTRLRRVFCPPSPVPVQRAPRRPVLVPDQRDPRAARVRGLRSPARGHRTLPHHGRHR
jgi:hypothetical protein